MDLGHLGRVLWRFKFLVAGGLVLGVALAVLSVARPTLGGGRPGLQYRSASSYLSNATVFITQTGFPWGRTTTPYIPGNNRTNQPSVPTSDAQRLSSLTSIYAQLAVSDPVHQLLPPSDQQAGQLFVAALPAPPNAQPPILPLLRFSAIAHTPATAVKLVDEATLAFQRWLSDQQRSAAIPASQRVVAQIIAGGSPAKDVSHHSKALPIMVFLAIFAAAVGLALTLENLRPRVPVSTEPVLSSTNGNHELDPDDEEEQARLMELTGSVGEMKKKVAGLLDESAD
jgi:hypothetical protein